MKKFSKLLAALLCLGLAVGAAACGGTDSTSGSPNSGTSNSTGSAGGSSDTGGSSVVTPVVGAVEVEGEAEHLMVEETATLTAVLTNVEGVVDWSSSNPEVATVDVNGLVTAVAAGEATITATVGETSGSYLVTVYDDEALYWLATNGYVYDEDNAGNKEMTCTEDGVKIYVNEEGAEYAYPIPKAHAWVEVEGGEEGEKTCTRCHANAKNATTEIEYFDGIDFTRFYSESPVATIELGGEFLEHEAGVIVVPKETEHTVVYSVTYEDGNMRIVTATVWSLIISDADELLAANSHAFENPQKVGQWRGWFKMDADVDMTGVDWTRDNMIGYGSTLGRGLSFSGIFDGCGHTIEGFTVDSSQGANDKKATGEALFLHTGAEAVIKNINFVNAANNAIGGAKASILVWDIYGGRIENISIELTYGGLAKLTYGQYVSAVFSTMGTTIYSIVLKDITVINRTPAEAWLAAIDKDKKNDRQTGFCAFGLIDVHQNNEPLDLTELVTFENITVIGYPKNITFLDATGAEPVAISAMEELADVAITKVNLQSIQKIETKQRVDTELDVAALVGEAVTSVKVGIVGKATDEVTVTDGKITLAAQGENTTLCYEVTGATKTYQLFVDTDFSVIINSTAETDVKTGLDFTTFVAEGETVARVRQKIDGKWETLELTDNKLTFVKEDASQTAKEYRVYTNTDNVYEVAVTVWSLIIDTPEELTQMNAYAWTIEEYWLLGYYKLAANIDMTNTPWTTDYMVTNEYLSKNAPKGFIGLFDGCNFEIQNFSAVANGAIFFRIANASTEENPDAPCGTIKNVKFTNAKNDTTTGSAILSMQVAGGLIENVSIDITYTCNKATYGSYAGTLFNAINPHKNMQTLTLRNVTITNNTDATAWANVITQAAANDYKKPRQWGYCALGNIMTYNADGDPFDFTDNIILDNFTATGFGDHLIFVKATSGEQMPSATLDGLATDVTAPVEEGTEEGGEA